jgi:hypothetical protein
MDLMKEYGVPVPKGACASTPAEAKEIATGMLSGSSGVFFCGLTTLATATLTPYVQN